MRLKPFDILNETTILSLEQAANQTFKMYLFFRYLLRIYQMAWSEKLLKYFCLSLISKKKNLMIRAQA